MRDPQHHLDRLFWLYGGNSSYPQKPIKWEFVADDGYRVCVGKAAKKWTFHKFPASKLYECEICKKRGISKRVPYSGEYLDPAYPKDKSASSKSFDRLCMSCSMSFKNYKRAYQNACDLKSIANQTLRKLNESTKNNARIA